MDRRPVYGDRWAESTLDRAVRVGHETYQKAARWQPKWPCFKAPKYVPPEYLHSSIHESFRSCMKHMKGISNSCKYYHFGQEHRTLDQKEREHCGRYHTEYHHKSHREDEQPWRAFQSHPHQHVENVHVFIPPGSYAVSVGEMGGPMNRTEICVDEGGSLCLDFKI